MHDLSKCSLQKGLRECISPYGWWDVCKLQSFLLFDWDCTSCSLVCFLVTEVNKPQGLTRGVRIPCQLELYTSCRIELYTSSRVLIEFDKEIVQSVQYSHNSWHSEWLPLEVFLNRLCCSMLTNV